MIICDLGDGLVLRHARRQDSDALAAFNAEVHRVPAAAAPDAGVAAWTRDLIERPHPTFAVEDFTVVEDSRTGAIVSSLNLISQTWSYGGVPFGVGRIELVGTHPDYRRRGLVRAQFEVVHRWSADRGQLVQGITGIPWYYRQFGYEYALAEGGGRYMARAALNAPSAAGEPFRVRPATADDLPFIAGVDEQARRRYLVTCVRDGALWRYELDGRSEASADRFDLCLIETAAGKPVGFLAHRPALPGPTPTVGAYELRPGVSWLAATPSVLSYLRTTGEADERRPGAARFEGVAFILGLDHPVYRVLPDRWQRAVPPYAWYIRVPDLPAFVRQIAPVLEARLAASEAAGYSGELRLNFFRHGLRLRFQDGRLGAAPWLEAHRDDAGVSFPDLTFLQLLFGHRALDELEYAFPDCRVRGEEARVLLTALFPKQPSLVWAIL